MVYNGGGDRPVRGASDLLRGQVRQPAVQGAVPLDQPHARAPEPRLLDRRVHRQPDHAEPGALQRSCLGARGRTTRRARHRRALRPRQHAPRQPRHDRPAGARRRRAGDRRHARGRHLRLRLTATTAAGETTAVDHADRHGRRPTAASRCRWPSVCHAIAYKVYRRPAGGAWSLLADARRAAPTGAHRRRRGPRAHATPTPAPPARRPRRRRPTAPRSRPTRRTRPSSPALTAAGIRTVATDASKELPEPADRRPRRRGRGRQLRRARRSRTARVRRSRATRATSTTTSRNRAEQLDEYNWIYTSPPTAAAACRSPASRPAARPRRPGPSTSTSETRIMFRHLVGNDPRPHYFHQSNLADYNPALPDDRHHGQGGIAVPGHRRAAGPLRGRRSTARGAARAADARRRSRRRWRSRARGRRRGRRVTAWLQDGRVHVKQRGRRGGRRAADRHDRGRRLRRPALRLDRRSAPGADGRARAARPADTAAPAVDRDAPGSARR